ncbi:MAG: cytochrome b/b6 domain-containing protein [Paracoccaceae bacterium]
MTDMPRPHEGAPPDLWDPVVRISHWVIAGVVVANAVFTKGGGALHVWLGWVGMAFLIVRLVWGLVGTAEARFAAFPPRPRAAIAHLLHLAGRRRPPEYRSHNPASAMMVYALWASLAVVMATGLVMTKGATPWEVARQQAAVAEGDWSALVAEGDGESSSEAVGESGHLVANIHELGGNLLLILAVIHVGGVLVESAALRRNVVRPMLLGRRR